MHSEGILAGELKHGPLALIDKQMPVIMIIMKDPCFTKCQNALQQVTARQVNTVKYSKEYILMKYIIYIPYFSRNNMQGQMPV